MQREREREEVGERKRERTRQREGGLRADGAGRNGREIAAIMRRNSSHNKTPLLK